MESKISTVIRESVPEDANSIYELLKLTWLETYSSFIPLDDLLFYLSKTYSSDNLIKLFEDKSFKCFTAIHESEIAGWLKLFENTEAMRFYLSSIYVLPKFQKFKIGRKLINLAYENATHKGYDKIYIGVMNSNKNALEIYLREGFTFFDEQPFFMGATEITHKIGYKVLNN
ncbi:MAG: GNAT family N-acetyltransferase [Ignavibacteriaceae bacterium]|nr:GNAT family N-acetyltransferase [Ignavibacteriaceae bacterium]